MKESLNILSPLNLHLGMRLPGMVLMTIMLSALICSCSYDEEIEVCRVNVQLVYPANSIDPYEGARVEMKDATASVFVDSTDSHGAAHFTLPPGIYEATTNAQYIDSTSDVWWRYIFNGVKSMIVVSPDSANQVSVTLKMSKKRIVH